MKDQILPFVVVQEDLIGYDYDYDQYEMNLIQIILNLN